MSTWGTHLDRRASSESTFDHITKMDLNSPETQFDRRVSSENDFEHIGDACGSAPMARFTRYTSNENEICTSRESGLIIENNVALDKSRAKRENT